MIFLVFIYLPLHKEVTQAVDEAIKKINEVETFDKVLTDLIDNKLNDQIKSRWIVEITPIIKQDKPESAFEDRYSIVRKTFLGEKLTESESITVSRKNLLQLKDKIDSILNECM